MSRTKRKTYTITQKEVLLLGDIKDKALSHKVVLNDSQIVRMGLHALSELSIEKIIKISKED